jgi:hypothetical protein
MKADPSIERIAQVLVESIGGADRSSFRGDITDALYSGLHEIADAINNHALAVACPEQFLDEKNNP